MPSAGIRECEEAWLRRLKERTVQEEPGIQNFKWQAGTVRRAAGREEILKSDEGLETCSCQQG